jgi:putative endonuclease
MPLRSDPADWRDPRHRQGVEGEEEAMDFLMRAGWVILAHRFRMGRLEIDLVARKDSLVAFVEVKTRMSRQFGSPLEAVTWSKQREIGRVAQAWMDRNGRPDDIYRFDVIGITRLAGGARRIEHVADAFRLSRP